MKNQRVLICIGFCVFFTAVCLADQFDDAETLFNRFMDRNSGLRKLKVNESKDLVKALCDAEEAERSKVAQDAGERIKNDVNNKMDELTDLKEKAVEALNKVIADDKFKDKKSKAEEYKAKVDATWVSINKITNSVRGSNNPVAAFMLKAGQEAHYGYEKNSSNCTVDEFRVGSGQADCINASSCEVIEVKPNNSRSIYVGRGQAQGYVDILNQSGSDYQRLVEKNRDFEKCKGRFKKRIALYTICPEIDDDGDMKSLGIGWAFEE